MIALRALRLALIVFVLVCVVMTLMAVLLGTGHPQTTLTPGVVSPTPSSPTGLPAGPTFSSCSYACNSQYLACVNPCSTAAGIAAGTPFTDPERRRASANCRGQHQSVLFLLWIAIRLAGRHLPTTRLLTAQLAHVAERHRRAGRVLGVGGHGAAYPKNRARRHSGPLALA
jgi:hypothetical protein